jgi:glycosyltransferase involved in cell wall biosynthesis
MKVVGIYSKYPAKKSVRYAEGGKRINENIVKRRDIPLVSIITVCFNSENTIQQTFDSIRHQSYPNIEYIVIDGGSNDSTVDLIINNEDLIDYYISEPDEGLYHAMNKGLSLATGNFIIILNSDDWYEPDTIERLVNAHQISGADIVGALARYINADDSSSILPSMRFDHATLLRMPLRHQTMLIPAGIYDEIGPYNTNFPIIADFEFTIRLYKAQKTYFEVSSPLLNFRTTGVSSTELDRLHMEHKELLLKVFPFLSIEQVNIIYDHTILKPSDLIQVALANYNHPEFVLAVRDMIRDFGRIWGGVWAKADLEAFDRHGQPAYPKISIVMPVYNASQFIESSLRSVLDQDFDKFEVICVNDCSTDNSAMQIKKIAATDPRIRLIDLYANIGPAGARNIGIKEAHGEFLFFLDSDDAIAAGALSRLYKIARENRSDIVRGAFQVNRKIHGKKISEIKYPADILDYEIKSTNLYDTPELLKTTEGHWACIYDRSFVETILYPEDLTMGEDSLFIISAMARAETISTIPDVVYHYQDNDNSAMNSYTFKKYMDEIKWRRKAWNILKSKGACEKANYFLFDYWDLSSLDKIYSLIAPDEVRIFFTELYNAFSFAGSDGAEKCLNPLLRENFTKNFIYFGLKKSMGLIQEALKIAVLTSSDSGGAGIASQRWMHTMRHAKQEAFSICIFRHNELPDVFLAPLEQTALAIQNSGGITSLWNHWIDKVSLSAHSSPHSNARELFSRTDSIVDNSKLGESISSVDLVHLHWVTGMIDYSNLDKLIGEKPTIWTLHDMNAFTGGCHYSEGCENYRDDCSNCPLLEPGSNLANDAWRLKRESLKKIQNLHIICPSNWLANCVANSSLLGDRPIHVIPNFLPVDKFTPTNKVVARLKLGIPADRKYIVFGADSLNNTRKGGHLLAESIRKLSEISSLERTEILFFGESTLEVDIPARSMGYVSDPEKLSLIFAAADVFAFPSLEDNAPQTVVEAMLSGTPVVGFPVGNVPELVRHLETGYIASYGDSEDLARGLNWVLSESRTPVGKLLGLRSHLHAYAYHEPSLITQQHLDLLYSVMHTTKHQEM